MSANKHLKTAWRAKRFTITELLTSAFRASHSTDKICCEHNLKAYEKKNFFVRLTFLFGIMTMFVQLKK